MSGNAGRGLRRDARLNLERIQASAVGLFAQRGLDVPMEEIARTAGVSIGTLYNRFPSREALIDAVMSEIARTAFAKIFDSARAQATAWERFATFVQRFCALQADEPALNDALSRRYPNAVELAAVCDEAMAWGLQIMQQAQAQDALRPDFIVDDLFVIFWSNSALVRASHAAAPDAWRRNLAIVLDGLRMDRERVPLPSVGHPGQIMDALNGS